MRREAKIPQEKLLREAENPATPPARLAEIEHQIWPDRARSPLHRKVYRALVLNPSLPPDLLADFALSWTNEGGEWASYQNPVLPLLDLEDPGLWHRRCASLAEISWEALVLGLSRVRPRVPPGLLRALWHSAKELQLFGPCVPRPDGYFPQKREVVRAFGALLARAGWPPGLPSAEEIDHLAARFEEQFYPESSARTSWTVWQQRCSQEKERSNGLQFFRGSTGAGEPTGIRDP